MFLAAPNCLLTTVRNIKTRCKSRGIKVYVGQNVHPGHILFRQIKLRLHPGLNVSKLNFKSYIPKYLQISQQKSLFFQVTMRNDMTLVSLKEGKTYITCEMAKPKLDNVWIQHFYSKRDPGQQFYKKYIHVIATEQEKIFRLVDQV